MQEQQVQNSSLNIDTEQNTITSKNILKIVGIVAGVVVLIGICSAIAFGYYNNKIAQEYENKFLPNTYINGISVDKQSVDEVIKQIEEKPKEISVVVDDGENQITISGADIDMKANQEQINSILSKQDNHDWIAAKFGEKEEFEVDVDFDKEMLRQKINELQCVSATRQEPVNATIEKAEGEFRIVPSVVGNKADAQVLFDEACELFDNGGGKIDATKTYKQPEIKDDDLKLNETLGKLNGYLNADIVYNIDGIDDAERLDKEEIETMLVFDAETLDVSFDEEAIKEWLRGIGTEYDTVGTEREYITPEGEIIKVSGGEYGWITDEAAEFEKIKEDILSRQTVDRDFTYVQEAKGPKGNEVGERYIDANLTTQTGKVVDHGEVIYEFRFVSGTNIPSRMTTLGFYSIGWKASPHVMVGDIDPKTNRPEYETPCDFFLCFNLKAGMALHDADSFRSDWRINAYLDNGSHGCLNCHYSDAKWLYNNIEYYTPVIVHI